jgi:hypothetical protein
MKTFDLKNVKLNERTEISENLFILLTDKKSGYGSGKKTVYSGTLFYGSSKIEECLKKHSFTDSAIDRIKVVASQMSGLRFTESAPRKSKITSFADALENEKAKILDAIKLLQFYGFENINECISEDQIVEKNENLKQLKAAEAEAEANAKAKADAKVLQDLLKSGGISPEILAQMNALLQAAKAE